MKKLISLLAISAVAIFMNCKKEKEDKTPIAAALLAMSQNTSSGTSKTTTTVTTTTGVAVESSTSSSGAAKVPANTPVGRQVKAEANSKVTQTVNLSTSSSVRQTTSQSIVKLNIFKKDGSPVPGCSEVTSLPGATKITLTCTVPDAGEYIIQLTTTATASITFEPPVGGTVVATADSQGLVPVAAIFTSDPTYEATKNILVGGILSNSMTVITVYQYDPVKKVLNPYSDATVKVTFNDKPETTLNYGANLFPGVIANFAGYNNTTSPNLPGYYDQTTKTSTTATGGNTLRVKITGKNNSFSIDKTLTYPNSISNIKLGGVSLAENASITVSRAAGVEVTWDVPTTYVPEFVTLTRGYTQVIDFPKNFSVPASSKSYKYTTAELNAYTTLSSANSADNCLGVTIFGSGNQVVFPSYFNGEATYWDETQARMHNSALIITNTDLIPSSNYNSMSGACESGVTAFFSGGGIGVKYPKIIITD